MVKTGDPKSGKLTLETNDLDPGTYFIHIHYGKEVLSKQIIVK
ncbi:T9SS type A sorting domain-containing protein [Pleomorphovibrio marinus]